MNDVLTEEEKESPAIVVGENKEPIIPYEPLGFLLQKLDKQSFVQDCHGCLIIPYSKVGEQLGVGNFIALGLMPQEKKHMDIIFKMILKASIDNLERSRTEA